MSTVQDRAGAQRRFGFVSILWWVAFFGNILDSTQNHRWGTGRYIWAAVAALLAVFFTWTWWRLKKGSDL